MSVPALTYFRRSAGVLLFVSIILIMRYLGHAGYAQNGHMADLINRFGIWAPIVFIVACAATMPAFVPPVLPIVLATMAFGKMAGTFYSLLGMTIGAYAALLLARYAARTGHLADSFKTGRFRKVDEWMMKRHTFGCMLGLRLIFFNSPAVDYVLSKSGIGLRDHLLGTFIGLTPRTVLTVYAFELFIKINSLRDVLSHPLLLSFPMLPLVGVLLLMALRRSAGAG